MQWTYLSLAPGNRPFWVLQTSSTLTRYTLVHHPHSYVLLLSSEIIFCLVHFSDPYSSIQKSSPAPNPNTLPAWILLTSKVIYSSPLWGSQDHSTSTGSLLWSLRSLKFSVVLQDVCPSLWNPSHRLYVCFTPSSALIIFLKGGAVP